MQAAITNHLEMLMQHEQNPSDSEINQWISNYSVYRKYSIIDCRYFWALKTDVQEQRCYNAVQLPPVHLEYIAALFEHHSTGNNNFS